MAVFTSFKTGAWDTADTWTANSGHPGDGDTVVIAAGHTVTVDADTVIGANADDATTSAITIATTGVLAIATTKSLTIKGMVTKGGVITLAAGSSFLFDEGTTSQEYGFIGSNMQGVRITGTSESHCNFGAVTGSLTNNFTIGWDSAGSGVEATYCDFVNIGNAAGGNPLFFASSDYYTIDHCTFSNCRPISLRASYKWYAFTNNLVSNARTYSSYTFMFGGTAEVDPGGPAISRKIDGNIFLGPGAPGGASARYLTVTNNYIENGWIGNDTFTTWENNFIKAAPDVSILPATYDKSNGSYYMSTAQTNGELLYVNSSSRNVSITDNVLHHDSSTTSGDDNITCGAGNLAYLITITGNIILPDAVGHGPGTCFQYPDSADNVRAVYKHNTVCVSANGESGVCVGYQNYMNTGKLEEFKSNLFWTAPGKTGGYKAWRPLAGQTQDCINPAQLDYNWGWGLAAGSEGNGFNSLYTGNAMFTVATSTLDTHGGTLTADPFVDYTRNVVLYDNAAWGLANANGTAWATDHGTYSVGDVVSAATTGFYGGATINYRCIVEHTAGAADHVTDGKPGAVAGWRTNWEYQSCYRLREDTDRIALMIAAVKAGFRVQSNDLYLTGHDGDTIGAMDGVQTLTIADSVHAHRSSNLVLNPGSGESDLMIADSVHATISDLLTLTTAPKVISTLTIPDSVHATSSDNLTLTSQGIVDLAAATTGTARYDVGDLVRVIGSWKDPFASDVAVDPTVVKCSIRTPSGSTKTYLYGTDTEMKKESVGVYYLDVNITESGTWYYRWWSTGTAQAANEGEINVDASSVVASTSDTLWKA